MVKQLYYFLYVHTSVNRTFIEVPTTLGDLVEITLELPGNDLWMFDQVLIMSGLFIIY